MGCNSNISPWEPPKYCWNWIRHGRWGDSISAAYFAVVTTYHHGCSTRNRTIWKKQIPSYSFFNWFNIICEHMKEVINDRIINRVSASIFKITTLEMRYVLSHMIRPDCKKNRMVLFLFSRYVSVEPTQFIETTVLFN